MLKSGTRWEWRLQPERNHVEPTESFPSSAVPKGSSKPPGLLGKKEEEQGPLPLSLLFFLTRRRKEYLYYIPTYPANCKNGHNSDFFGLELKICLPLPPSG